MNVSTSSVAAPGLQALVERLDALLPQTQCTRCGYPDCRAYARAMASGEAPCNRCPPGGTEGIGRLAGVLGQARVALDPAHGTEAPRQVVFIDEARCIGCTLCIQACPVDAIVGAPKRMHAVVEDACTGCELCLPACPVDCLVLENASGAAVGWQAWSAPQAEQARQRYLRRTARRLREEGERAARLAASRSPETPEPAAGDAAGASPSPCTSPPSPHPAGRPAAVEAALERARARLAARD